MQRTAIFCPEHSEIIPGLASVPECLLIGRNTPQLKRHEAAQGTIPRGTASLACW